MPPGHAAHALLEGRRASIREVHNRRSGQINVPATANRAGELPSTPVLALGREVPDGPAPASPRISRPATPRRHAVLPRRFPTCCSDSLAGVETEAQRAEGRSHRARASPHPLQSQQELAWESRAVFLQLRILTPAPACWVRRGRALRADLCPCACLPGEGIL